MALPYDTNKLIQESKAMLAQTAAEGTKPYAGSSFQTGQPITSAALTPTTPLNFQSAPQTPPPAGVADSLQSQIDAINAQYNAPLPQDEAIKTERTNVQDLISSLYGEQGEKATRAKLEADPALQAKRQQVQDLTAQANMLIAESKAIPIRLQQEAEGRGVTAGGLAPIQAGELRKNAIAALGVGSLLSAAQGNLSLALDQVDRAIKAEFEPKRNELEARRANLELLMSDPAIGREEKRRGEIAKAKLDAEATKLAAEEENKKLTSDAIIKIVGNNSGNPKMDSLALKALQAAKTPLEASMVAQYLGLTGGAEDRQLENIKLDNGETVIWDKQTGKIVSRLGGAKPIAGAGTGTTGSSGVATRDAESVMSGTLNLQDISVKDNYRASVAAELAKRQKDALASGDMVGVMRSSAAYDKEPSDTFLQSMEKTLSVVSQIGVLQENINGENTGPIVGAFRNANPWDTQAQTIKAQLNAIVPNLARGVYGEVGVLTDNDIKQYAKTIPTLTSTEDIRNAILYITLDQIRKNVEIKIKNQASGQRDMSGYADVYQNLNEEVSRILSTLPQGVKDSTTPLTSGATGKTSSGITWTIE